MTIEKIDAKSSVSATVERRSVHIEDISLTGKYAMECFDADGNIKWSDKFDNLVTTVGKNYALEILLGSTPKPAAWYMGLVVSNGYSTIVASDTMASHSGWIESGQQGTGIGPRYNTAGNTTVRPVLNFTAASGGSKATANAVAFNITAAGTVKGAFLTNIDAKANTNGILYSAGLFTEGDKAVTGGDIVRVSYIASA